MVQTGCGEIRVDLPVSPLTARRGPPSHLAPRTEQGPHGSAKIETIRERRDSVDVACHTVVMKRSVRSAAAIVATGLVLVACGTADDAAPVTDPAIVDADADAGADSDPTPDEAGAADGTTTAPADEGVEADKPDTQAGDTVVTSDSPAADEAPSTDAPAPVEAVIGGRSFAAELSAESDFAENMFPDLLVDDIRSGAKVNFRNVFPADRPVLIWAWAPH